MHVDTRVRTCHCERLRPHVTRRSEPRTPRGILASDTRLRLCVVHTSYTVCIGERLPRVFLEHLGGGCSGMRRTRGSRFLSHLLRV